jgi:cellulose biosynthesis protein BcsQ
LKNGSEAFVKTVAMFNNKGGVGKTTLTCNLASYISINFGLRVLIIDCDPQCNTTQLILGLESAADLYSDSKERAPSTIEDALRPLQLGDSSIETNLEFVAAASNRFRVDLLPGHPEFAIIEDRLGAAWQQLKGRDVQGFRQTNWNVQLCKSVESRYDLVFFDLGPSLGSINRSVLMGCEHFATPLGSDIFSIIGVKNIANWLKSWIDDYAHSWTGVGTAVQATLREQFGVLAEPKVQDGFVGYTIQQYITKSYGKERRATKAYEQIIGGVDDEIFKALQGFFSAPLVADRDLAKLGDIPHLYSLVPLAQKKAVPIHDLRSDDGLVGSQYSQVQAYKAQIDHIATSLVRNLGLEPAARLR